MNAKGDIIGLVSDIMFQFYYLNSFRIWKVRGKETGGGVRKRLFQRSAAEFSDIILPRYICQQGVSQGSDKI